MQSRMTLKDQFGNDVELTLAEDGTLTFSLSFSRKCCKSDVDALIAAQKWSAVEEELPESRPRLYLVR